MTFSCRNKNERLGFIICVLFWTRNGSYVFGVLYLRKLTSGKVCVGSCRNNFSGLGHLIISGAVFPSSFLWAQRSQSASALIYPLSLSHQSPPPHHTTPPPPFTFCSPLPLSCQEKGFDESSGGRVVI